MGTVAWKDGDLGPKYLFCVFPEGQNDTTSYLDLESKTLT